jgi:hypothetical protein
LLAYPIDENSPQYVIDKRASYKGGAKPGSWIVRSEIEHSHFSHDPLSVLNEDFVTTFGQNTKDNSITVNVFKIYDMPYKTSGKSWAYGSAAISWYLSYESYGEAFKKKDVVLCRFEGEFRGKTIEATTISEYNMNEGDVWTKFDLSSFRAALIDVVHDCSSEVVEESKQLVSK